MRDTEIPGDWFPRYVTKRTFWNLEGALPYPNHFITCPFCEGSVHLILRWNFGPEQHGHYYCDVTIKCMKCSHVSVFGVEVPKEMVDEMGGHSVVTASDYLSGKVYHG